MFEIERSQGSQIIIVSNRSNITLILRRGDLDLDERATNDDPHSQQTNSGILVTLA
jgi:hypothetical protein